METNKITQVSICTLRTQTVMKLESYLGRGCYLNARQGFQRIRVEKRKAARETLVQLQDLSSARRAEPSPAPRKEPLKPGPCQRFLSAARFMAQRLLLELPLAAFFSSFSGLALVSRRLLLFLI